MATRTQDLTTRRNGVGTPLRPKIATHLQLVSPKQARDLLQTPYPNQRPLRPHHVRFLQGLIERGTLRPGTTVSFGVVEGTRYLVNGQHTLTALGQTTGGPLWLQLEEIRVDTLEAVGQLYESYDRNLARSWADIYHADTRLQVYELGTKHLSLLGGACLHLATGFQSRNAFPASPHYWVHLLLRDVTVRFGLMQTWCDELQNCLNGCQGPGPIRKLLTRAAVLSVALVTYRFQPEAAHLFWPSIARDSGLSEGQPAHSLLRFLRDTPTRKVDTATYSRYVASAWNAHFESRPMHRLQARAATPPLLLAGTPHDGRTAKGYLTRDGTAVQMPEALDEEPDAGARA